jgi:hypothetical protein
MYNEQSLHNLLDKTLEVLDSTTLSPPQRARLEAAEKCICACLKAKAMSVVELCYIFDRIVEYIEPPDRE